MYFKALIICSIFFLSTSAIASTKVLEAYKANSSDVAQAEKFLRDLPEACSGSYAYASDNGAVTIRLICIGYSKAKSMDGTVIIKNGVVTQIK